MPYDYDALVGKKLGHWTVLSIGPMNKKWSARELNVKCICGKEAVRIRTNLIKRPNSSCGCMLGYEDPFKAPQRRVYLHYRWEAQNRGLDWELSEYDVTTIGQMHSCSYDLRGACVKSKEKTSRANQTLYYEYWGIDRVDNNKGYIKGNCIPCCYSHNFMKSNFTLDQMIDMGIMCQRLKNEIS